MKTNDRKEMLTLNNAPPRATSQNDILGVPGTSSDDESPQIPESVSSNDSFSVFKRHVHDHTLAVPEKESQGHACPCQRTLSPLIDLRHDSAVESDDSRSENSLFRTQCTFNPIRTPRKRSLAASPQRPLPKVPCQRSSDSSPESVTKFSLKKFFERRKKRSILRSKSWKAKEIFSKSQNPSQQFRKSIPAARHQRRWKDEAGHFPFLDQKDLTLNMIFTYEQASLWGFLHHMEKLKYDRHLQESLRNLNVSNESDDGQLDARRYPYLDDDGPISPIPDETCSNAADPSEYDAKVVDNSCFILNWKPSTQKKLLKKRKKNVKRVKHIERHQEDDVAKEDVYYQRLGNAAAENSDTPSE